MKAPTNQEYSDRSRRPTAATGDRLVKIEIFLTAPERVEIEKRLPAGAKIGPTVREVAEGAVHGLAPPPKPRPASPGRRLGIIVRMTRDLADRVRASAQDEGRSDSEFLVLRLLALPVISNASARPRVQRILDQRGLIIVRLTLIINLLRAYQEAFVRHAKAGDIADARALLQRIELDAKRLAHGETIR